MWLFFSKKADESSGAKSVKSAKEDQVNVFDALMLSRKNLEEFMRCCELEMGNLDQAVKSLSMSHLRSEELKSSSAEHLQPEKIGKVYKFLVWYIHTYVFAGKIDAVAFRNCAAAIDREHDAYLDSLESAAKSWGTIIASMSDFPTSNLTREQLLAAREYFRAKFDEESTSRASLVEKLNKASEELRTFQSPMTASSKRKSDDMVEGNSTPLSPLSKSSKTGSD